MNLQYIIKELSTDDKHLDIDGFLKEIDENHESRVYSDRDHGCDLSSQTFAMEIDYEINYSVKTIGQILEYYKISKRKLCKQEMIHEVVVYEIDEINQDTVNRRKMLWKNIKELKDDEYFSKYILSEWP